MSTRVRATLATMKISASRITGDGVTDQENVVKVGFRDMGEYWDVVLSEPMRASLFIHLLATHHFEPTLKNGGELYKLELARAIRFASMKSDDDGGMPLIRVRFEEAMVRPREFVERLLNMPMRRHLVPETLKDFIERKESEATVLPVKKVKRQKASPTTDRVVAEMKCCGPEELKSMKQEAMAAQFKANRETCRNARNIVLSVLSADKKPTIKT